jgi:hypothetical protein
MHTVAGETVFRLYLHLPSENPSAVYVRVEDFLAGNPLTADSFFDTLQGKGTGARALTITARIVLPDAPEDVACVTHGRDSSGVRWPRHWEIVFLTGKKDYLARQLDFFGIELAVPAKNKFVYAFHLSQPIPDTRVLEKPGGKEHRYYLVSVAERILRRFGAIELDKK